jgi:hypothetical protein
MATTYVMQAVSGTAAIGAVILCGFCLHRRNFRLAAINAALTVVNASLFASQILIRTLI